MTEPNVRQLSPEVEALSSVWPMLSALMGGTRAMRAAGKIYLPQFPNEDDAAYRLRLAGATLHPVFKRTVRVDAARPFAKPPVVEDVPDRVLPWLGDVDLQGSSLAAFGLSLMTSCLSHGLSGVLVDGPKVEGVVTAADEVRAGLRPYLSAYAAQNILGWKLGRLSQGYGLTQVRLLESVAEDDGAFGSKTVEQVRVLTPGAWQVWRATGLNDEWAVVDEGETRLETIPFVFFYGIRTGFGCGEPPLLELAYQNIEHYQSSSDQQNIEHVARVPILFAKKFGDAELTIGAGTAASSDEPDAELSYVEHSGAAIKSGADSILRLEARMRATGAELIQQTPDRTTATQVDSEGEASQSLLQQITGVFEDSLTACVNLMALWAGEPQTACVKLFKAFGPSSDSEPSVLAAAREGGTISARTHFDELKRRNIIAPERGWDEELERLSAEEAVN